MTAPALALAVWAGASPAPVARRVAVGAYVNDIQRLDLKSHSFTLDLYLWMRWKDPALDPPASLEFVNPFELWSHTQTREFEKPLKLPDGSYYQVIRHQGPFSQKLPLNNYPFDRQVLAVEFEDLKYDDRDLVYETDPAGVSVNAAMQLPGFQIGSPRLTVVKSSYPTGFGDPRADRGLTFSRVRLEIPIRRPILTHAVKRMLPILCVLFCAALMFLFNPRFVDARVGIGITALLTVVALQLTLNADLPEVHYLVLMDKIYLGAYLYVILGLAVVVKTTWMYERGQKEEARRLERASLVGLSASFAAVLAVIVAISL